LLDGRPISAQECESLGVAFPPDVRKRRAAGCNSPLLTFLHCARGAGKEPGVTDVVASFMPVWKGVYSSRLGKPELCSKVRYCKTGSIPPFCPSGPYLQLFQFKIRGGGVCMRYIYTLGSTLDNIGTSAM